MTNRQKQALETRKTIVSKGKELLIQSGIEDFTIDELAQACGVAKGTFYHYFKTKDEFVLTLTREPYLELEEQLKQMREQPVQERIRYYIGEHTRLLLHSGAGFTKQYYRAVLGGFAVPTTEGSKVGYDMRVISDILTAAVEDGQLRPDTPVHELAEMFFAALCGRSICWCVLMDEFDPEAASKNICEQMIEPCLAKYLTQA